LFKIAGVLALSADAEPLLLPDAGLPENTLEEQERRLLVQAMKAADGNQSRAARLLRIGCDTLRYKLKKHNLDSPDSLRGSAAAG
jgi:DNA-binding NtrC family response regulator